LAQDRDNPIKRNEKKKRHDGQFPTHQMLNDEIENQFFLKKKRTNKSNSQPRLTIKTGDSSHELETKLIEEKL